MTIEKINPETLPPPHGHTQTIVATGTRFVFTSGQVSVDVAENLIGAGPDYEAQGYTAVTNAYEAVIASGASAADVVRMTLYVVDPSEANLEKLYDGIGRAMKDAKGKLTAMTLVGITGLTKPGTVVEVEMTAVTD